MNWYHAENAQRSVRQIVLGGSPGGEEAKSRFGTLLLTTRFMNLLNNTWVTDFFYLDSDPGPYLMVRGDGVVSHLRGRPVTAAFSFYRMKAGGLVAVYVHVDCPAVAQRTKHKLVLFEIGYGLDDENKDNKKTIERAMGRDSLDICFAEGSGTGEHLPSGGFSSSGIDALYDVILPMPAECRAVLKKEYDAILSYHSAVPASTRSYDASVQQMWAENPQGVNPILPRPIRNEKNAAARPKEPRTSSSERKWWQFWK